jgi:hypothetical protein
MGRFFLKRTPIEQTPAPIKDEIQVQGNATVIP